MTGIKGFHIGRGALRALSHAQGQLSHNQKQMVLFLALDTLARVADDRRSAQMRKTCPRAFETLEALRPILLDSRKRGAMFAWDMEAALGDTLAGLKEIAAYCRNQTLSPSDTGEFRRVQMMTEAAASFIEMVQDISRPDVSALRRASKVNPCVTAAFLCEYMHILADRLEEKGRRYGELYIVYASRLTELGSKIRNNIPEQAGPLYEIGERKISVVYNLMNLLSEAGEMAKKYKDMMQSLGDRDPQIMQGLDCLFQTAAVYDWQQFETAPAGGKPHTPPPNNLLRLRM